MQRIRAQIHGKVQGVGYRAWTVRQGCALGLAGEVRNLNDGSVEVLMEGDEVSLQQMLNFLHKGPGQAEVRSIQVSELDYVGNLVDFVVLPS